MSETDRKWNRYQDILVWIIEKYNTGEIRSTTYLRYIESITRNMQQLIVDSSELR